VTGRKRRNSRTRVGAFNKVSRLSSSRKARRRQFDHRLQLRVFAWPEAVQLLDLRLGPRREGRSSRRIVAAPGAPGREHCSAENRSAEKRQQLGLGQRLRAAREQPLARPFACRPVFIATAMPSRDASFL